ncbi:amidohydrolase family protein [Bifidobacterium dolichotidis]|uniref:Amidohydrolase family protein n=1 Tax=Bifidobacterium dolichotidis TaxID=2306976 RepID=A0A430FSZ9_9BIFI|nr:dihydroorotase [Bifidobacterium dolichotidis]RSX56003.1 amidohydrolase family protein [Bifidobacterium dolichotidis]
MALTLTNLTVWNTDEVIDLVLDSDDDHLIDCTGLMLSPGLADPHVHFRDPGQTYKEDMITGTLAAAAGGYTQVLIMPNTEPAMDGRPVLAGQLGASEVLDAGCANVIDYLQHYNSHHDVQLPVHYDLCASATIGRAGIESVHAEDIAPYLRAQAEHMDAEAKQHPVIALSDDGAAVPSRVLDVVCATVQQLGLFLIEHCEHHEEGVVNEGPVARRLGVLGIPEHTELDIVNRDIEQARRTGVHVHFQHISTAVALDAIRKAKAEGLPITCETAPHYIALCDESILDYGTMAKMNPPLRSVNDRQAVLGAIADGTIDMIATDHAPHTLKEKQSGFTQAPNGIIGLECAYAICHTKLVDTGIISEQRLIELMSINPNLLMGHQSTDIASLLNMHHTDQAAAQAAEEYAIYSTIDAAMHGAAQSDAHAPDAVSARRVLDITTIAQPTRIDLTIFDTTQPWTIDAQQFASKARNTPFDGWTVTGKPMATIVDGQLVWSRLQTSAITE